MRWGNARTRLSRGFIYQQEHVRGNGGQLDAQNAVNDVEEDVKHLQSSQRRGGNVRQWGIRALPRKLTRSMVRTDLNLVARCLAWRDDIGEAKVDRAGEGSSSLNLEPNQRRKKSGSAHRLSGQGQGAGAVRGKGQGGIPQGCLPSL